MKPLLILFAVSFSLAAQDPKADVPSPRRIEIVLEKQEGGLWKAVDPGLVFEKGDRVRFRFRANFDGFLYVMDYGTSGRYSLLFPREETGKENRIASGKEYPIPATETWFRIAGPPGHDIVYWMVSPLALASEDAGFPLPALPKAGRPAKTLLPRCDDSIFRARGECIDSSAGLRNIPDAEELPENLKDIPRMDARELVIMRKEQNSLVFTSAPWTGPVICQFRLAHK